MANLKFCDTHNVVAFLLKHQGSEDFYQILDFLNGRYIRYALTENPTIYVSPINQFWHTASTRTHNNGEIEINATVDGHDKTITEASVKRHLKLADADGISTLPTTEIFEQIALMRVETALFPTMLVNEQLSLGEGPTSLVGTQHTPTIIETSPQLQNLSITYRKTRNRIRRMGIRISQSITKEMHDGLGRATTTSSSLEVKQGSARPERLSNLPNEPPLEEGNTSRSGEGSMQLLELMDICTKLSGKVTTLENELSSTKAVHNKALITLTKRVKKLEKKLKLKRRSAVVDSSEDEEASLHNEDSSKQGRMIEEIDEDENVNLVKSSKQGEAHDTARHRMESDDTEVVDFSTASPQNDDDEVTLAETLVNIKMSATKDKGKAIMQESEPPKKLKKKEMIQIGHDEELAQKLHAEELVKDTARQEQERYDFEKALELQKQLDEREKVVAKSQARDIDWSDPAVLRYHAVQNRSFSIAEVRKNMCIYLKNQGGYKQSHFKGMSYEDIRPIFERVWDQNHAFVPKDSEIEKEVMKRSGFDLQQESLKQVEEEIVQQDDVVSEQVVKESSRKAEGRLKRKTSKARKDKDKRQKNQDDPEKLTLMEYVEVISDSEEVISVIPLAVKSSIVSWKSYCKEDVGYYEIHRADRSYKTYMFFSEMLNDFDREDLIVLYRLFNEKYASTRPGFDDLMLWGDMKIMFKLNDDDVVWKNHHSQELIEWKLYDSCRVHSLMLGEVSIHMLVKKKYPLPQDTLMRMLQWKLHVNYNVTEMAYELLRIAGNKSSQSIEEEGAEGEEKTTIQGKETPYSPTLYHPSKSSSVPLPSGLKKQKNDDDDERLLSIFRQIHINLPFLEAMIYMTKGAKRSLSQKEGDIVLEMDEDELVLIILGRPFLITTCAVIDVHDGKLKPIEPLEWKAPENWLKPSTIEPPKLVLKEMPEHLEYAFLQEDEQLLIVISFALSAHKKTKLLDVLKNYKGAIAWSIADIKGTDSSFCTYKILMEDKFKLTVQP
ncbi:hypothetical protein Tco_0046246 [Tanacetum coccineum]